MKLKLVRLGTNGDATIGALYIDGKLVCGTVEDEPRAVKVWGETRIPEGTFKMGLRKAGSFHSRYKTKFADIHKGMLCVYSEGQKDSWKLIGDNGHTFQYILLHLGNSEADSAGCILLNSVLNFNNFTGQQSTVAYKKVYPMIANYIEANGDIEFTIVDIEK